MFYGQCWKCGERWELGTASACKCPDEEPVKFAFRENNDSTEVLRVTPEGEFIWHEDADRMIEEGDFSQSPALPHILKVLRKQRHEQEPVAKVTSETGDPDITMSWWHEPALPVGTKLYTTPIYEVYEKAKQNSVIGVQYVQGIPFFPPPQRMAKRIEDSEKSVECMCGICKLGHQRQPLTDEEIWKFWWARPEVQDGEDDSMEAEFVAAVRAVLVAHGIKEKNNG